MAKISCVIGFYQEVETKPGVWDEKFTEYRYFADLTRVHSKFQSADKVNDDITMSNEFSIIGDPFAFQNFAAIKYVEFMGTKWKIESVEVRYPRLILRAGGVYNGH